MDKFKALGTRDTPNNQVLGVSLRSRVIGHAQRRNIGRVAA